MLWWFFTELCARVAFTNYKCSSSFFNNFSVEQRTFLRQIFFDRRQTFDAILFFLQNKSFKLTKLLWSDTLCEFQFFYLF